MLAASGPQAVLLQNPDGSTQYVLLTSDQQQAVQLALHNQSANDKVRCLNCAVRLNLQEPGSTVSDASALASGAGRQKRL